jgi:hypothetical protein
VRAGCNHDQQPCRSPVAGGRDTPPEAGDDGVVPAPIFPTASPGRYAQGIGHHTELVNRSKTVLTDVGPVQIDVPRDRDSSFEPRIVASGRNASPVWTNW